MFRYRPKLPTETLPPTNPIEGFFFRTEQKALNFGIDRTSPVPYRPALSVRRRDRFMVVLPATSQPKSADSKDFFSLAAEDVRWTTKNSHATFLYHVCQTIAETALGPKIGVVSQNARMAIANWLRQLANNGAQL